jgi:hypothetical protein
VNGWGGELPTRLINHSLNKPLIQSTTLSINHSLNQPSLNILISQIIITKR